jgi:hypothetical protein
MQISFQAKQFQRYGSPSTFPLLRRMAYRFMLGWWVVAKPMAQQQVIEGTWFKRNMNAPRKEVGARLLYPEAEEVS